MEINAKLVAKLDLVTGTSSKGEWRKKDMVFETLEQFPKKICISFWNALIDSANQLTIGDTCNVSINVESRDYNGRWYTEVKAWKIGEKHSEPKVETKPEPKTNEPEDLNNPDPLLPF